MGGTGSAGSFSGAWRYAALIFLVGACMVGGDDGADPAADSPLLVLPTFEAAMGERPLKWGWWSPDDRAWVPVLEDLYNRHLREPAVVGGDDGSEALSDVRIPRIIHQVWLGGDPLPAQFQEWRATCAEKHPEWKMMLWTETEAVALRDMVDPLAYQRAPNLGAKSDALRLEVVYRFGGLYLDTDFECLSSLEPLHQRLDFFAGLSNVGAIEISNGIFGARKRHPLVKRLLTESREAESALAKPGAAAQLNWIGMATIAATGPGRFTRVVMDSLLNGLPDGEEVGAIAILPTNFFFPIPNSAVTATAAERARLRSTSLHPESLAVHHWAGSWLKQQMGLPVWEGAPVPSDETFRERQAERKRIPAKTQEL